MFRLNYVFIGLQLIVLVVLSECSGDKPVTTKRVQKCQEYSSLVFGNDKPICKTSLGTGAIVSLKDFPYNGILGYQSDDKQDYSWYCIATLISSRYLLSVAHCLNTYNSRHPVKVRLGTLTIATADKPNSSDYDIDQIIVHPDSSKSVYNDIGLIKLSRKVEFSESIRPICLPDVDSVPNDVYLTSYQLNVKDKTDIRSLIRFEMSSITNEACNETYSRYITTRKLNKGITDQLMCTQDKANYADEYSCDGRSGSPIYIAHPHVACSNIQLGSSALGVLCSQQPDVGIRVFNFADWIESIIWADGEDI